MITLYTRNMMILGQSAWDVIKILWKKLGHLISNSEPGWTAPLVRIWPIPFASQRFWHNQGVHRDSERQLHFDTKFDHEEEVLVTQKCFAASGNGLTFDTRHL